MVVVVVVVVLVVMVVVVAIKKQLISRLVSSASIMPLTLSSMTSESMKNAHT